MPRVERILVGRLNGVWLCWKERYIKLGEIGQKRSARVNWAALRISSCMMGKIERKVIDGRRAVIASVFSDLLIKDSAHFWDTDLGK